MLVYTFKESLRTVPLQKYQMTGTETLTGML